MSRRIPTHVEDGVDDREVERHESDDGLLEQQDPGHGERLAEHLPSLSRRGSVTPAQVDVPGDLGQSLGPLSEDDGSVGLGQEDRAEQSEES